MESVVMVPNEKEAGEEGEPARWGCVWKVLTDSRVAHKL